MCISKQEIRQHFFQEYKKQKKIFANTNIHFSIKKNIKQFFQEKNTKSNAKVMLYEPYNSEVPILDIFQQDEILSRMYIYVPYIRMKTFFARQWNARNIIYPNGKIIDYIFVPGLFVDFRGVRLGRGRGCYDRILDFFDLNQIVFPCYSWQYLESRKLPKEEHDKNVGYTITEKEIISLYSNG